MSVTRDDVIIRFPEFADTIKYPPGSFFDSVIAQATQDVCPDVWKTQTDIGIILLTAHLLAEGDKGGNSGSVKSEKVNELSRTFFTPSNKSSGGMDSTTYGQQFLQKQKARVVSPIFSC